MRIWHYALLPFLPDSVLEELWADIKRIYKGERDLYTAFIDIEDRLSWLNYSTRVAIMLDKRSLVPYSESRQIIMDEFEDELNNNSINNAKIPPYANYHDFYYLIYCGSILNELFALGLKDYSEEQNDALNFFLAKLLRERHGKTDESEDDGATTIYDGERYHQA